MTVTYDWKVRFAESVIGVDECGVGPIAGPLTSAAVLLREGTRPEHLDRVRDSKKLSQAGLHAALVQVMEHAELWYCSSVPASDNVQSKHKPLMAYCVDRVMAGGHRRDKAIVVVDGNMRIPTRHRQTSLINGDRLCLEVACASVIAKYLRDRRMLELHELYPQYGFDENKGYATAKHAEAIREYGLCPVHREKPALKAVTTWATVGLQRTKDGSAEPGEE